METILTNYLFQHSKYKEMFHAMLVFKTKLPRELSYAFLA